MNKPLLIALSIVLLLFLLVGGVGLLILREMPLLNASLALDSTVEVGDTIDLVVSVDNPHEQPVTLDSVDIDLGFLEGFEVVRVKPEPTLEMPIFGMKSWSFDKSVPPDAKRTVVFTLKATEPGRYSGDVDVCNPNQDFHTLWAEVVVRAPAGEAANPPE